ncbi:endo alpha-1,4 polygalactosaminidase [Pseudobutyrivibrio sp.]|uniref:endo alpha-1,4 polygalactosaminidase n=1 Tax=Pseudobutyrivibrio sp. TaxID=2014367 RepID=UPI001D7A150C|nr:endo alpha-1,4 polygalactosaminidase [Pseudobutyrivibrio sp.]MBE5909727.1 hypothetical protein [Pseudobutyrivibrio sp.]
MNRKFKITFVSILFVLLAFTILILFFKNNCKADNENLYGVYLGMNPEEIEDRDLAQTMVIDAQYYTEDEISALKDKGHNVYTYLNLGSIESFRDYYSDYKDITLGIYENWEDEQWVDVSSAKWQEFISSKADELLAKGVDGFFVDNCDVYYQYPTEEIFTGVSDMLEDLKAKGGYVLINGGDAFVTEYYNRNQSLDNVLDGVNQESVYTCIYWDDDSFGINTLEDREYFSDYLNMVMDDDKDAYALEYATDSEIEAEAMEYDSDMGYITYVSHSLELK